MKISVECYAGYRGEEAPRRLLFDGRPVEVVEIIDRWFGLDHRYFKVRGSDQATYIIRHDTQQDCWEMTMYQTPHMGDGRVAQVLQSHAPTKL